MHADVRISRRKIVLCVRRYVGRLDITQQWSLEIARVGLAGYYCCSRPRLKFPGSGYVLPLYHERCSMRVRCKQPVGLALFDVRLLSAYTHTTQTPAHRLALDRQGGLFYCQLCRGRETDICAAHKSSGSSSKQTNANGCALLTAGAAPVSCIFSLASWRPDIFYPSSSHRDDLKFAPLLPLCAAFVLSSGARASNREVPEFLRDLRRGKWYD